MCAVHTVVSITSIELPLSNTMLLGTGLVNFKIRQATHKNPSRKKSQIWARFAFFSHIRYDMRVTGNGWWTLTMRLGKQASKQQQQHPVSGPQLDCVWYKLYELVCLWAFFSFFLLFFSFFFLLLFETKRKWWALRAFHIFVVVVVAYFRNSN